MLSLISDTANPMLSMISVTARPISQRYFCTTEPLLRSLSTKLSFTSFKNTYISGSGNRSLDVLGIIILGTVSPCLFCPPHGWALHTSGLLVGVSKLFDAIYRNLD